MHGPETVLCLSKPLRSREIKQPPRLNLVLLSAMPLLVHGPKNVLCISKTLHGREAIQPPRL